MSDINEIREIIKNSGGIIDTKDCIEIEKYLKNIEDLLIRKEFVINRLRKNKKL